MSKTFSLSCYLYRYLRHNKSNTMLCTEFIILRSHVYLLYSFLRLETFQFKTQQCFKITALRKKYKTFITSILADTAKKADLKTHNSLPESIKLYKRFKKKEEDRRKKKKADEFKQGSKMKLFR